VAGAEQLGCTLAPFVMKPFPATFPNTGNWKAEEDSKPPSPGVFAASVAGVLPSTCLSWFQAEQACALSGKRLATNQEWQRAVAGTPDPLRHLGGACRHSVRQRRLPLRALKRVAALRRANRS